MATYQFAPEHNGIEIYFDEKPSESIRRELKINGWRWHTGKGCWFTKNSSSAESLAKKLCSQPTPILPPQDCSVTIYQNFGSTPVGTLTISKSEQGYSLSSTNNQVVCCDCNRFFSIHAQACPFCGCPINYVAEYYYKTYNPELIRQQQLQQAKKQQEEQRRIQKEKEETEKKKREGIIEAIVVQQHGPWSFYADRDASIARYSFKGRLEELNSRALTQAGERFNRIQKLDAPIRFSDEAFLKILCGNASYFEKVLQRIEQIKTAEKELQRIKSKEWDYLSSLNDNDFSSRIQFLIADERNRREKATKEAERKEKEKVEQLDRELQRLCTKYNIGSKYQEDYIKRYGSKQKFLHKLQTIDTIGGDYRRYIQPEYYLDRPDELIKVIKTLK